MFGLETKIRDLTRQDFKDARDLLDKLSWVHYRDAAIRRLPVRDAVAMSIELGHRPITRDCVNSYPLGDRAGGGGRAGLRGGFGWAADGLVPARQCPNQTHFVRAGVGRLRNGSSGWHPSDTCPSQVSFASTVAGHSGCVKGMCPPTASCRTIGILSSPARRCSCPENSSLA
jgi:hypothetical protein